MPLATPPARITCAACGADDDLGGLSPCGCGAPLHADCAQFSDCPRCPAPGPALPLPATPRLRARRAAAMTLDVAFLLTPALGAVAAGFVAGLGPLSLLAAGVAAATATDTLNTGLFLGEGGATFGKRLVGLRLVDERGRNLGWRRALTREFLHKLFGPPAGQEAYLLEA